MRIFINYIFTSEPLKELNDRGFVVHTLPSLEEEGYVPSRIIFKDEIIYELREILDEELYLKKFKIRRFEPWEASGSSDNLISFSSHPNSIEGLVSSEENKEVLEHPPVRDYLKWRKNSPLKALTFFCKSWSQFSDTAHPEKQFKIHDLAYSLIHLGPNCIDLIVRKNTVDSE